MFKLLRQVNTKNPQALSKAQRSGLRKDKLSSTIFRRLSWISRAVHLKNGPMMRLEVDSGKRGSLTALCDEKDKTI